MVLLLEIVKTVKTVVTQCRHKSVLAVCPHPERCLWIKADARAQDQQIVAARQVAYIMKARFHGLHSSANAAPMARGS